jgi:hypothetical protein
MHHRLHALIAATALIAAVACTGDGTPAAKSPARPDSSSGEVAQYALMKNRIGWLTDSNIVALASQVNGDASEIARLETQTFTKEPFRMMATQIVRDHERFKAAIDSLAAARRLPSQMPAVAPELKAPYDSMLNTQVGLPVAEREAQFIDMVRKAHAKSLLDFGALAGNASDPDLKALLGSRAVLMEQTHIAQMQMLGAAIAHADSVKQDSLKASGRGGRR